MTSPRVRSRILTGCLAATLALSASAAGAPTRVKPGFNIFSVEQDVEIGRRSAAEAERELPILSDRSIGSYVDAIGQRLARVAPGAEYPYQFKVVNASDINAFALPGGFMYVNRGLIEAAGSEGELAGVMAHEIAHVALRHGTNQASKAYLGQAGLGILGGLLGKDGASTEKTVARIGGFGLNALFLKHSRAAEEQADVAGAQMLARAGYDPQDREPNKLEQFFASHPPPSNRAARIAQEKKSLKVRPTAEVGGFRAVRTELAQLPPARSLEQLSRSAAPTGPAGSRDTNGVAELTIDPPSPEFRTFEQRDGFFRMSYPDNWRVHEPARGLGVTIAPDGGLVGAGDEPSLVYGVVVNHYEPFDGETGPTSLTRATSDLVTQLRRTNPDLRMVANSARRETIDGAPALSVVLSGRSPVTRAEERVTVFTRELADDHLIYALFIAPGQDYSELRGTFDRMFTSLRVGDEASHP
jgi:Zn-dependent protease with chaperone function